MPFNTLLVFWLFGMAIAQIYLVCSPFPLCFNIVSRLSLLAHGCITAWMGIFVYNTCVRQVLSYVPNEEENSNVSLCQSLWLVFRCVFHCFFVIVPNQQMTIVHQRVARSFYSYLMIWMLYWITGMCLVTLLWFTTCFFIKVILVLHHGVVILFVFQPMR